jgi:endo-1,4-beta-xylanase
MAPGAVARASCDIVNTLRFIVSRQTATIVTLSLVALLMAACPAGTVTTAVPAPPATAAGTAATRNCLEPGVDCSLAEVARQSGIAVGAAVDSDMPPGQLSDVLTHFSAITTENAFKWGQMSPSPESTDFSATDRLVSWAQDHGLRIRAHTLFWHRSDVPDWVLPAVERAADPAAELSTLMRERIQDVVGRYKGKVQIWDVVNEPLALLGEGYDTAESPLTRRNFFFTTLGERYIDDAFRSAHEADPNAKLFLNEIVWNPELGDPKADALLALLRRLRERGVPIHGVGIQVHGMVGLTRPWFPASQASLARYLKALGDLGVKVEITELDVALPLVPASGRPLDAQADVFGRVAGACGQVSACTGLTVWGLRDPDTWMDTDAVTRSRAPNRPLLLDADGRPKPAYAAVARGLLERCANASNRRPCSPPWP